MSKISELSDGGSLISSDYLIAVRSGGNVKVRMDQINVDQVDLGDNEFIRLGNSQDLTMVHTSTQSIINQAGIGDLLIQRAGATKLTINASGIDVTGTVTADGLTVDASSAVIQSATGTSSPTPTTFNISTTSSASDWSSTSPWGRLAFYSGDGSGGGGKPHVVLDATASNGIGASSSFSVSTTSESANTLTKRLNIAYNGDISFYNNAAAQGLFWDSSASALGLGTTTPSSYNSAGDDLVIASAGAGLTIASAANDSGHILFADSTTGTGAYTGFIRYDHTTDSMRFAVNAGVERLRIDASGNVGIGTSSPLNATNQRSLSIDAVSFPRVDLYVGTVHTARLVGGTANTSLGTVTSSPLVFNTTDLERMRIDASGNVGIGVVPKTILNASTSTGAILTLESSDTTLTTNDVIGGVDFYANDSSSNGTGAKVNIRAIATSTAGTATALTFGTSDSASATASERLRIDASGNLLVGKSANDNTTAGHRFTASGFTSHVLANDYPLLLNRLSSDGALLTLRKDSVTVGSIGTEGGTIYFSGPSAGGFKISYYNATNATIFPVTTTGAIADGLHDIGYSASRFRDIYATNGTIQTSDRNEKQDIVELSDAEQRVAVAAKGLLRKFRWKSSVAEKNDEARTHFGIIAQDLQAAFEAEGLDAGRYAMFIHSTWTDEETGEERSRMGVRYSELLAFIIAAI